MGTLSEWLLPMRASKDSSFPLVNRTFFNFPPRVQCQVPKIRKNSLLVAALGPWREVLDRFSGRPYYWNTETNETSWEQPVGWKQDVAVMTNEEIVSHHSKISFRELLDILLGAEIDHFSDIANKYRPICFEDEFFEFLTKRIETVEDEGLRERLEKLRARLSNPLLRNPPPY